MADLTPADRSRLQAVPLIPSAERAQFGGSRPVSLTSFVGRSDEIAQVCALLNGETHLVTLTGPGGVGKTRLALAVAAAAGPGFPDGTVFAGLAALADPALVLPAIGQALGVRESGDRPLAERLGALLGERRLLLVLDNLEHLVDAAPQVAELLGACPGMTILATSRVVLRLSGEQVFPVPPLPLLDPTRPHNLTETAGNGAVALFVQRAHAADPEFALTAENAAAVVEIARRLDGLPLAIELAAARVRLFPPQALLARLGSRLTLLTGGARDLPARQQTLRGAIDWSYSLLQPAEQILFARLAVFLGARTFEAIEAVCNPDGALDVLACVESLVEKSLLRQEEGPGDEPRFVMLETIHEYARERLELREEGEDLRLRHAEYFRQVAEAAMAELRGAHHNAVLARLMAAQENLRAALSWALERQEGETALWLALALLDSWMASGQRAEARQWLEAALAATEHAQAAVPDAAPARELRAKALSEIGLLASLQGDFGAARLRVEEALALRRTLADKMRIARSLELLASIANDQGDYATSRARYAEAVALTRELGNPAELAVMLNNVGWQAYVAGDDARALVLLEESLALLRHAGDTTWRLAVTLVSLGPVLIVHADYARAGALLREGLRLAQHQRTRSHLMWGLEGLAWLAAPEGMTRGQPVAGAERAARLFGAAAAWRETAFELLTPAERSVQEHHVAIAQVHLDEAAWQAAWAEGRAMPLEQAVAYALEETATFP